MFEFYLILFDIVYIDWGTNKQGENNQIEFVNTVISNLSVGISNNFVARVNLLKKYTDRPFYVSGKHTLTQWYKGRRGKHKFHISNA